MRADRSSKTTTAPRLRDDKGRSLGAVVVFEDLSALIKAQKAAAWQEVAQRIAHEIKNPLTPIQLSAERLRKKFLEGAPDFNDIVDQSTRTIVNEVSGLKRMVDEFSNYARMPVPVMERQSLHATLNDVVMLYKGAHRDIEFVTDLDEHRSEEHTSELQSLAYLVCRLLLEKKKQQRLPHQTPH